MPKKSRKGRMKYKVRRSPKVSAVKEASQAQPLPVSSRQAVMTKSSTTIGGQADRYRPVTVSQELRHILFIAVPLLVLLIVLSFLLR